MTGEWRPRAACRDEDPELFFNPATADEARAVCARCPVRGECYREACAKAEPWGVWGGTQFDASSVPAVHIRDRVRGMFADGLSPTQVARQLGVHTRTVERWRANLRAAEAVVS